MNGAGPSSNHDSSQNASPSLESSLVIPKRDELVRLIVQALDTFGYDQSARELEKESGILSLSPEVTTLRTALLQGDWTRIDALLSNLTFLFKTEEHSKRAKFCVYRQKFLELLESGDTHKALECLKSEVTPFSSNLNELQSLTLLVMYQTPEQVRLNAHWPGAGYDSRYAVLESLRGCIPPDILLPERRLEKLLTSVLENQVRESLFPYTKQSAPSLLEDLELNRDKIPSVTRVVLSQHDDEVWYVQFSYSGKYLASGSKDKTALIYDVEKMFSEGPEAAVVQRLVGHHNSLSFLAWSPCDTMLLTCGNDKTTKLWNVKTGQCIKSFEKHQEVVTSCSWFPSGKQFATGSIDKFIHIWDLELEEVVHSFHLGCRVSDLSVSKDGKLLVAVDYEKKIRIFDLETKREKITICELENITSLCISDDCTSVAANVVSQTLPEILLWNLSDGKVIRKFRGHRQARFVIRSCFGGYRQKFVISGSEDSFVYVWNRETGDLLFSLGGHTASVNSVAWNPADPAMFASASDDKTVRVWGGAAPLGLGCKGR